MKIMYHNMVAALLCAVLLCGCAANTAPDHENANNTNMEAGTEDPGASSDATVPDDTTTVPDESGAPDSESGDAQNNMLTSEELAQWESYFNTMENNGLLRFPYADLADDPDQLAPYLAWLFYDIGEYESTFSEEELALLAETDLWLQLDARRLSRDYLNDYLMSNLNIPADKTENLFDAAEFGVYLPEYDAWYMSHGDTEFRFYDFEHGIKLEDGTVKLHYFNDFLRVAQDDGEMDYIDAEMIVTLAQREDGTWYVVSHEIDWSVWND